MSCKRIRKKRAKQRLAAWAAVGYPLRIFPLDTPQPLPFVLMPASITGHNDQEVRSTGKLGVLVAKRCKISDEDMAKLYKPEGQVYF